MNGKKIILLVGALVIAVVTAVMAKNMFSGSGANQAQAAPVVPAGPKVLIARKPLPVGTIIEAEDLVFQDWPKELLDGTYYTEEEEDSDPTGLYGTVVRNAISAGQPVWRKCWSKATFATTMAGWPIPPVRRLKSTFFPRCRPPFLKIVCQVSTSTVVNF